VAAGSIASVANRGFTGGARLPPSPDLFSGRKKNKLDSPWDVSTAPVLAWHDGLRQGDSVVLWESYQQTRIAGAERIAENAESKVDRFARKIEDLERHLERLSLACQAMWELLQECSDLKEEDIEKKVLEIDGRDGSVDGKITVRPIDCPSCGRKTSSKRSSCVMCGAPIKRQYPFAG